MLKNSYPGKFTSCLSSKNWFISLEGKNILPRKNGAVFIVFEGLDGSGQTTQAELLRDFLIKKGYQVVLTKEPTLDSETGKKIYQILNKKEKKSPKNLQELFVENRKEHLKNVIIPALKKGKIVISDRYFFSTFAYGAASGVNLNWLIKLNEKFLLPDLTFILKAKPETCIERIKKRGSKRTLFEEKEKLRKVWKIFQILTERFENVYIIEGEKSIKEVFFQIKNILHFICKN